MAIDTIWLWVGFNVIVLALLAVDLGLFHRDNHTVTVKEALIWSVVWTALALVFNGLVFYFGGAQKGLDFLTGYVIERSLSIDNIFVFIMVFAYFSVPSKYQYKVLFWGILGALIMRAAMILVGTALIERFHFVIYVFGALLIFSAFKMATQDEADIHPERNPVVRFFTRFGRVTSRYHEDKFFIFEKGVRFATPLFIVLLVVESTDLIFAVDSIPAIFAITTDPFIVYTSNVFAILGMRALYFALAGVIDRFHYLKAGLAIVLAFVGLKMLLADWVEIPTSLSLGVVAVVLVASVVVSLLRPPAHAIPHPTEPLAGLAEEESPGAQQAS